MLMLPLPFLIGEIVIFIMALNEWGFMDTVGMYLMPSLLGFILLSIVKKVGWQQIQMNLMLGKKPEKAILHSAAIFVGAILLIVPSFFTRVFAVILLLPGLRHFAIWKLAKNFEKRAQRGVGAGAGGFSFGAGPFGGAGGPFGGAGPFSGAGPAGGGFKYYQYRSDQGSTQGFEEDQPREREIDAEVVDVTPIEITHTKKTSDKSNGQSNDKSNSGAKKN